MKTYLFLVPLLLLATATWAVAGLSDHPTVDYVLGMLEAGMEEEAIITRILEKNLTFRVAEGDIDRLRQAGASDRLIITVVREGVILENRRVAAEEKGAPESAGPGNGSWTRPRRLGKPEMMETGPEEGSVPSEEAGPSGEGEDEEESEEREEYDDYLLYLYLGGFAYLGYPFYSYPYYYGYPYGSIYYYPYYYGYPYRSTYRYPYGHYGRRPRRYGGHWHSPYGGYKWGRGLAYPRGSGNHGPRRDGRHYGRRGARGGAYRGGWSGHGGWARGHSFKWSGGGRVGTGHPASRGSRGRPRSH